MKPKDMIFNNISIVKHIWNAMSILEEYINYWRVNTFVTYYGIIFCKAVSICIEHKLKWTQYNQDHNKGLELSMMHHPVA